MNLQSNTPNFLTWKDVSSLGNSTATWGNSKIIDASCNTKTSNYYAVSYTQSSLIDAIEVLEILPIAKLHTIINPAIGISPLTMQICPSASLCGSFPYERIVWDYGDGSDIDIVTRYTTPNSNFIYTGAYSNDINDPRNYNAIHTYTKIVSSTPTFYPSITAYSMNTNQYSIANTVVGPISYGSINTYPLHIMKVRNSIDGNMYGIQSGNNFSVINTLPRTKISKFSNINPSLYPSFINGLQAYWRLDELGDIPRIDIINNDQMMVDGGDINSTIGKFGNATEIDGGTQLSSSLNYDIVSMSCWVNPLTLESTYQRLLLGGSIQIYGNGNFSWDATHFNTGVIAQQNTWYHICMVYNIGIGYSLWINGIQHIVDTTSPFYFSNMKMLISDTIYTYPSAAFSQLGIWNRALTDVEITELYNNGNGYPL